MVGTTFQIVLTCSTEHGAYYFMDARSELRRLMAQIEDAMVAVVDPARHISVDQVKITKTIVEAML